LCGSGHGREKAEVWRKRRKGNEGIHPDEHEKEFSILLTVE
jgi:hypothetical protein